jgi:alanine racemase
VAGAVTGAASRSARVRVDLGRLAANYRALVAYAGRPLLAVVKADAYGHGAVPVARCLERAGVAGLAVALVQEGVALREAGLRAPVLVLTPFEAEEADALRAYALTPVISTPDTLAQVLALAGRGRAPQAVHVKVDTGLSRLGFGPDAALEAACQLQATGAVVVEGLMTHLAVADEDAAFSELQIERFDACLARLRAAGVQPRHVHVANSAGLLHLRRNQTLARPGLLLYGLQPRPRTPPVDVRPVLSLRVRLALVKDVPAGTSVSYGRHFVARTTRRIATLPIGYGDGLPRTDATRTQAAFGVRGQWAPVAGTVCMDLTTLDVSDIPGVVAGDEVELLGDAPTAWDWADWAGTNAWQALTGLSARLPRDYVGAPVPEVA